MRAVALLLALVISGSTLLAQNEESFTDRVKRATAILFSQDENGGMAMRCTATAFEKAGDTYRFVTASHCIGSDDAQKEKVAAYKNIPFYISFDESDEKKFYRAKAHSVGYQHRGDDFAVFEVTSKSEWPIVPIGDEKLEKEGNPLINVASPLGLGKQVFHGSISKMELDRPIVQGDINWKGTMLIQMPGTDGGSSGSSLMSPKQEAIVGFLVGTIGGTTITAIPASRFTTFQKLVADKKYRWSRDDDEE